MLKIIVGALVVAALVVGGVLEIKVHPEQIGAVPGKVAELLGKPETKEQADGLWAQAKRLTEVLLVWNKKEETKEDKNEPAVAGAKDEKATASPQPGINAVPINL